MEKVNETTKNRSSESLLITATDRCRAVLAVWTEKRKPSEICKELGVKWTMLMQWQNRAMEGMLQALEPRKNLKRGGALSPRLQAMLAQREKNLLVQSASKPGNRLQTRLASIAAKTELKLAENTKNQLKE